jgi:hypothetical protein
MEFKISENFLTASVALTVFCIFLLFVKYDNHILIGKASLVNRFVCGVSNKRSGVEWNRTSSFLVEPELSHRLLSGAVAARVRGAVVGIPGWKALWAKRDSGRIHCCQIF